MSYISYNIDMSYIPYNIAISGKANSGKNTVAKILFDELEIDELGRVTAAFADPIKEGLLKLYPTASRECLWGSSALRAEIIPGTNVTYRQVLLDLGAQARRYDEDHWVKILLATRENAAADAFIVSDLRFPNEFEALKDKFFTIRIRRPHELQLSDVSETSQDKLPDSAFDFVIDNNSTLDALRTQCKEAIKQLKEKSCL